MKVFTGVQVLEEKCTLNRFCLMLQFCCILEACKSYMEQYMAQYLHESLQLITQTTSFPEEQ